MLYSQTESLRIEVDRNLLSNRANERTQNVVMFLTVPVLRVWWTAQRNCHLSSPWRRRTTWLITEPIATTHAYIFCFWLLRSFSLCPLCTHPFYILKLWLLRSLFEDVSNIFKDSSILSGWRWSHSLHIGNSQEVPHGVIPGCPVLHHHWQNAYVLLLDFTQTINLLLTGVWMSAHFLFHQKDLVALCWRSFNSKLKWKVEFFMQRKLDSVALHVLPLSSLLSFLWRKASQAS